MPNPCYTEPIQEYKMQDAKPFSGNTQSICKQCYDILLKNGYNDKAAKGFLANMKAESGFNYSVFTWDSSKDCSHSGIGGGLIGFYFNGALKSLAKLVDGNENRINQLNSQISSYIAQKGLSRCANTKTKTAVQNYAKENGITFPYSLEEQMKYVMNVTKNHKTFSTEYDAAKWFIDNVERPAKKPDRWAIYGKTIEKMLNS